MSASSFFLAISASKSRSKSFDASLSIRKEYPARFAPTELFSGFARDMVFGLFATVVITAKIRQEIEATSKC